MAGISFPNYDWWHAQQISQSCVLALVLLAFTMTELLAAGQPHDIGYVTVHACAVTPHLEAYGKIEPSVTLRISFEESGEVTGLKIQPEEQVRAGQELAYLTGSEVRSTILQSQADVRGAHARLTRLQRSLANLRQKSSLNRSTRKAVHRAEIAVAQARMSFEDALSHLRAVRQMMILRAPVNGTVLMLYAMDGEHVGAAMPILSLETPYRLRLTAHYYGSYLAAIRPGMKGMFSPADGRQPIPVRVRAVSALLRAGGGESITMVPADRGSRWVDGEFGTVTWNMPKRMLVAVPTRSLILDRGKWWVLVHTPRGDHPQAVVPGPSRGWQTFLEGGLSPGTKVVVENAYLLFHRNISRHYQPPD